MARNKALNVIKLLDLLSIKSKTKKQLAETLKVGSIQLKRYYQFLEDLNLYIDEDEYGRQFIFGAEQVRKGLLQEQEKAWICQLARLHEPDHPFTHSISQKLEPKNLPFPLPHQIKDANLGSNYEKVVFAIQHKLQIELLNYRALNKETVKPARLLEPLEFTEEHRQLYAYDPAIDDFRNFKIDRMEKVNLLETSQTCTRRKKRYTDAFGFSSDKRKMLKLRLSPLAKELLLEYHPMSRQYVEPSGRHFLFQGPVCNNVGVGRFILGLPGHVQVLYGQELKEYLKTQVALQRF